MSEMEASGITMPADMVPFGDFSRVVLAQGLEQREQTITTFHEFVHADRLFQGLPWEHEMEMLFLASILNPVRSYDLQGDVNKETAAAEVEAASNHDFGRFIRPTVP